MSFNHKNPFYLSLLAGVMGIALIEPAYADNLGALGVVFGVLAVVIALVGILVAAFLFLIFRGFHERRRAPEPEAPGGTTEKHRHLIELHHGKITSRDFFPSLVAALLTGAAGGSLGQIAGGMLDEFLKFALSAGLTGACGCLGFLGALYIVEKWKLPVLFSTLITALAVTAGGALLGESLGLMYLGICLSYPLGVVGGLILSRRAEPASVITVVIMCSFAAVTASLVALFFSYSGRGMVLPMIILVLLCAGGSFWLVHWMGWKNLLFSVLAAVALSAAGEGIAAVSGGPSYMPAVVYGLTGWIAYLAGALLYSLKKLARRDVILALILVLVAGIAGAILSEEVPVPEYMGIAVLSGSVYFLTLAVYVFLHWKRSGGKPVS